MNLLSFSRNGKSEDKCSNENSIGEKDSSQNNSLYYFNVSYLNLYMNAGVFGFA